MLRAPIPCTCHRPRTVELRGVSDFSGFHPQGSGTWEWNPGGPGQRTCLTPGQKVGCPRGKGGLFARTRENTMMEKQEFLRPRSMSQHDGAEKPPTPR